MDLSSSDLDRPMEDDIEDLYEYVPGQNSSNTNQQTATKSDHGMDNDLQSTNPGLKSLQLPGIGGAAIPELKKRPSSDLGQDGYILGVPCESSKSDLIVAATERRATSENCLIPRSVSAEDSSIAKDIDMRNKSPDEGDTEPPASTLTLTAQSLQTHGDASPRPLNRDAPENKGGLQPDRAPIRENGEANLTEWEVESSPYDSSSDDSSDTNSSGSDDDYELLDPQEQARRLMEDEGNSDDDKATKDMTGNHIKSHNEKIDEAVEIPNITITAEMRIEELGAVETIVENVALIRAKTSGEHQVLEACSLLCLEDRTVIGVVSETLGRVREPLYCVRFRNAVAMEEAGIAKSTIIFYVPQHSTFVFTEALRNLKGSDASNIYDEEAAEDEIEFSDDEAEADYKRSRKAQKQARRIARNEQLSPPRQAQDVFGAEQTASISYDEPQNDHYTPLTRPSNLHEIMDPANRAFPAPSRGHRGSRNQRGDRAQTRRRGRWNSRPHASMPPVQSALHGQISRGGASDHNSSNFIPSLTSNTSSNNNNNHAPVFPGVTQAYNVAQIPYSNFNPSFSNYPPDPAYQNMASPLTSPWGTAMHGGQPGAGGHHQQAQYSPTYPGASHSAPSQYPAGAAVNPWFFQHNNQYSSQGP